MNAFRKRADMLVLPLRIPVSLPQFTDNTMPKQDWSKYDAPAVERLGRKLKVENIPVLLVRQAS